LLSRGLFNFKTGILNGPDNHGPMSTPRSNQVKRGVLHHGPRTAKQGHTRLHGLGIGRDVVACH